MVKRNGLQTRSDIQFVGSNPTYVFDYGDRSLMVRHQFVALGMTVRFCPITLMQNGVKVTHWSHKPGFSVRIWVLQFWEVSEVAKRSGL